MMPTAINPNIDHQDPHFNTEHQKFMIDVSSKFNKFNALQVPFENSWDALVKHAQSIKVQSSGFQTICRDDNGSRWIIFDSNENTMYNALGPFSIELHQMEFNPVDIVTIIKLNENELVQTKGFGTIGVDSYLYGVYWVIFKKPLDHNEGPSFNVPATLPISPQVLEVEGEFHQTSKLAQFPTETYLHGSDHVMSYEFERLTAPVDANGFETSQGDDVIIVEHPCSCMGDSFCYKCLRIEQDTSNECTTNMPTMEPQELHLGSSSSKSGWIIASGQSSSPNSVLLDAPTHLHGYEAGLIEDLPLPMFDDSFETVHPALQQEPSEEISLDEETIRALGGYDGETECHVPNAPVATMSTNPRKRKARQPRADKHHGVIKRQGGRKSFVAYFRPKGLLETNKLFVTVGEFRDESDAWHAFNLFAMVHEGEESCMNVNDEDKESLEYDVDIGEWRELPRVDLLAYLRRKGRGFFKDPNLQDVEIPKYRNVKFTKNKKGKHKGKIRWFCDVSLDKEMMADPKVVDLIKSTSTFDTAEEAAKKADKLMLIKEGYMAWTNFTITDYLTEVEKEKWDKLWIPLDDNPRKYLSTDKY